MINLPSNLQILGVAGIVVALVAGGAYVWGRMDGAALTDAAVEKALTQARENTERAINELADEADQARVRRRLCIDRGGVWNFADNECIKGQAKP